MGGEGFGPRQLVTRSEAAGILRVDQATVTRLADGGHIWSIHLASGERRFRGPELRALRGPITLSPTAIPHQRHPINS